ncbi:hypothetical protein [Clostridium fallax]|uniref:Uncharacterized protein n=1 Tax=Clostridium fallax TaxID=1533 RepID=A0A1M4V0U2_9CLOT|nr:hypothetical protein [Clostridium fallax]SHE62565.1 hypothetical protein SAMN05443638_10690 [Clostridium fallax]SQB06603.1 Uncharacterised protein [Clostridium fallax]
MEVNMVVVEIAARRIMEKGENPKTHKTYVIDDVTNQVYRKAIENYILEHTEGII